MSIMMPALNILGIIPDTEKQQQINNKNMSKEGTEYIKHMWI